MNLILISFPFALFMVMNCKCGSDSSTETTVKSTISYSLGELDQLTKIAVGNGITFHPFEKIILISKPSSKINSNDQPYYRIFLFRFEEGKLCCEEEVPFSGKFNDYHPVFSPDGEWIYFNSDRPIPSEELKSEKVNIWRVSYIRHNWGTAEYLENINSEHHESYPSITSDGTLYFNSDRPGGKGSMDIYRSIYKNDSFSNPVLVSVLSSEDSENDLTISSDEKVIILNKYLFRSKEVEMYIAYNVSGNWTTPQPLSKINQKGIWELTPTLTPDSKYFIYEVNGKLKFIESSKIISL